MAGYLDFAKVNSQRQGKGKWELSEEVLEIL